MDKISQLKNILESVIRNEHSSFYRDRFSGIKVDSDSFTKDDWNRVPFVTREEITAVPFWKRVFVPRGELPVIRHTYGTSGKGILVTPRSSYGDFTDPYITMNKSRLMCFFASAHNECPRESIDIQVFFGDVGNLEISAKFAAQVKVDSLSITPYTALNFAPLLEKYGAIESIRSLMIIGERCSPLQFKKIKELYPNAITYGVFASSETREVAALPCKHDRGKGGSLVLEEIPEMYFEIINPHDGSLIEEYGVRGEFVITTLSRGIPFPLIRYRTGDIAMYTKRDCSCETKSRGFEILGRLTAFPVRMAKGELTVDAVEKALLGISEQIDVRYFEAHYIEEESLNRVLPRVRLVLVSPLHKKIDIYRLSRTISESLYVFPTYTYAQGVEGGIYLPLEISFLNTLPKSPPGKQKPSIVVRHVADSQSKEKYQKSVEM